jgi:hypothetical protein
MERQEDDRIGTTTTMTMILVIDINAAAQIRINAVRAHVIPLVHNEPVPSQVEGSRAAYATRQGAGA